MAEERIYPLKMLPGIQRDGTRFKSRFWIDGQHTRFQRGMPRKMGGYLKLTGDLNAIPRGTFVTPVSPNFNIYVGDDDSLKYLPVDFPRNVLGPLVDRTPVLFQASANNMWSFDQMFNTVTEENILIAHAAPNLAAIDSPIERPVYYGDVNSNDPLIETGIATSGAMVVLHPFLFIFGDSGNVIITDANDPTSIADEVRVTSQKIIAGMASRGGNSSPAGLLWSLNSLVRVTFIGPDASDFRFDSITTSASILSSNSVVEYDGIYYWAAVDRFMIYNGVVQELPNNMNLNFFFNNLNYDQRQKVWATKVTEYGEIWWHYPTGANTECDRAVIYNIREQIWYDTESHRSSGYFDPTFADPVWTGNTQNGGGNYDLWVHEVDTDEDDGQNKTAIESYIESGYIAWPAYGPPGEQTSLDKDIYFYRLEPDFLQLEDMTLTVKGRDYARGIEDISASQTFSPTTTKIDLREQRRELNLRFTSNELGGFYEMGEVLLVMRIGDTRP